jgi:hypothetical protein
VGHSFVATHQTPSTPNHRESAAKQAHHVNNKKNHKANPNPYKNPPSKSAPETHLAAFAQASEQGPEPGPQMEEPASRSRS